MLNVVLLSFVAPLEKLFAKRVDQQKSKMELETYFLGTISLIDTAVKDEF